MNKPAYYKTKNDIDILDDHPLEDETVTFITREKWADPLDEGNDGGYWSQDIAQATDQELDLWEGAYDRFRADTGKVHEDLEAARKVWEAAQEAANQRITTLWETYKPVSVVLQSRIAEAEELREENREKEEARLAQQRIDAQAAEDRELGPRTWVTFHPTSATARVSPTMYQPVIHLAGCKLTGGRENLTYTNEYKIARKEQVQKTLLEGAVLMDRGRPTQERIFTKLCGRCKPHASLKEALGDVYDAWLVASESVQEPMPKLSGGLYKDLGLEDEWFSKRPAKDGYYPVDASYLKKEKLIEPFETFLGWVYTTEDGRTFASSDCEDKLLVLMETLPERGFAVRRVMQPEQVGGGDGKLSTTGVAVRRMTKHEIRMRKENNG